MSNRPNEKTRVVLTEDVERYPFFHAYAGAVGTVVESDSDNFAVCFDECIPGAEEWDNEVIWTGDDEDWDNLPVRPLNQGDIR